MAVRYFVSVVETESNDNIGHSTTVHPLGVYDSLLEAQLAAAKDYSETSESALSMLQDIWRAGSINPKEQCSLIKAEKSDVLEHGEVYYIPYKMEYRGDNSYATCIWKIERA